MHPPRIGLLRPVRRLAPRSLLARSLLMILLPLVILQAIALQIFYGSHLELVSRRFGAAVAGEIGDTIALLHRFPDPDAQSFILHQARHQYEIDMRIEPGAVLPDTRSRNIIGPMDDDLADAMRAKVGLPFKMDWITDPQAVLLRVQLPHGVLDVHAPRKRLYTSTIYLFLLWLMGSSLLLFGIAAVFMRNQVRAIRRLAAAAEAFGLGREHPPIKPEGAAEVRRAATAFNRMQERLRRFLTQRTEMLAGVSHDLRTPLTRLRLALAMLPPDERYAQDIGEMTTDVEEMERMIGGYLAFARGEGSEQAQATDLTVMLEELAASARRSGARVELAAGEGLVLKLRPDAMRRAIANLLDNARRHARRITLGAAFQGERTVLVTVDDDGPGIPADRRESVFRPFESGAAGGTGLGLTIARDIVRAHGGEILLEDSPLGGLRARVRLPV